MRDLDNEDRIFWGNGSASKAFGGWGYRVPTRVAKGGSFCGVPPGCQISTTIGGRHRRMNILAEWTIVRFGWDKLVPEIW